MAQGRRGGRVGALLRLYELNPVAWSSGVRTVEEAAFCLRAAFSHPKESFVLGLWAIIF